MSMELMRAPLKLASAARDSTTEHSSARASHTIKHVLANEYARVRAAKRRGAVVGAGRYENGLGELRPVNRAGDGGIVLRMSPPHKRFYLAVATLLLVRQRSVSSISRELTNGALPGGLSARLTRYRPPGKVERSREMARATMPSDAEWASFHVMWRGESSSASPARCRRLRKKPWSMRSRVTSVLVVPLSSAMP